MSRLLESGALSEVLQRALQIETLSKEELFEQGQTAERVIKSSLRFTPTYRDALVFEAARMLVEVARHDAGETGL